jgi:putative SOS response-associated peptidase YedK
LWGVSHKGDLPPPGEQPIERLQALLQPYPADEMTAYPVSTLVNSPANDAAACIQPV